MRGQGEPAPRVVRTVNVLSGETRVTRLNIGDPIKGKCTWWREFLNEEDRFDRELRAESKRVQCMCFVEGGAWEFQARDVPRDCPSSLGCRYHIRLA